jgi:hypothetical protein
MEDLDGPPRVTFPSGPHDGHVAPVVAPRSRSLRRCAAAEKRRLVRWADG